MPDDLLDDEFRSYATHVQHTSRLPGPATIRQLGHRRRQRHRMAAAFGVVLLGVLGVSLGVGQRSTPPPSVTATKPPASSVPATRPPSPGTTGTPRSTPPSAATPTSGVASRPAPGSAKLVASDVSQLRQLGITLNSGVLIDVADDGLDRYLAIGENGVVDFTGTTRSDNTMMALKPARVANKNLDNRVVIAPPFYNEDLGAGSCVADTARGKLRLAPCEAGAADQTWNVIPAGDSGQFELHGVHTAIRVENGKIVTDGRGYVGLQTIIFAE
jgi:hypothetical protein